MTSREFLTFLERSLDYVSLDLVGMSLIILKKPYAGTKIRLKENDIEDEVGTIDGTMWMESKSDSSIKVSIKDRGSPKFNIETDLAKSFYKYYYRGNEEFPSLIHV